MSRRQFSFHYTLRDATGKILDTSRGSDPGAFVEGGNQIIEGLEEVLVVMAQGERREIVVPPEKGYGEWDESLQQKVSRALLPVGELAVGDQFQTGPDRHAPVVRVVALEGDEVLLDANHPLAGQSLRFEVELVDVRSADAGEPMGDDAT